MFLVSGRTEKRGIRRTNFRLQWHLCDYSTGSQLTLRTAGFHKPDETDKTELPDAEGFKWLTVYSKRQ